MQDTGRFLCEIDNTLPSNQDPRAEGAGQIRNLKTALLNTFPYLKGEQTVDTRPFIPLGSIIMYSGTKDGLTDGWEICDSARTVNGIKVPDLRGRFIMGADSTDPVGKAGGVTVETNMGQYVGAAPHKLTIAELPSHSHPIPDYVWAGGGHGGTTGGPLDAYKGRSTSAVGGNGAHQHDGRHIKNFDKRPAYYSLAYIIFVGMPAE